MKKLILLIAVAFLFTIFSCTPEEFETKPTKKVEKITDKGHAGDPDPDGPGDKGGTPPIKP